MIARPLGFATEVRNQTSLGEKRNIYFWPILRGIVIALPVIAIFASLLSSADPIFATRVNEFIDLFNLENLPEYIFRIIIFFLAMCSRGLSAAAKRRRKISNTSCHLTLLVLQNRGRAG